MEGFHKMQDDLEMVIESDGCSNMDSDTGATSDLNNIPVRQKLDHIIHSNVFMVSSWQLWGIIVLVIVDSLVVITELLFDLEIVHLGTEHDFIPKIFHYISLAILSIFLLEIFLRLYVMRLSFFKHKLEIFDATIVIVSFILDIVFRNSEDASVGVGLLIILRLWRVARLVNGIVMSVQKQANKKIEKEKHRAEACEKELMIYQEYCTATEEEIERLQEILRQHNIEFVTKHLSRPRCSRQTGSVANVS
ncbi:unnamed protein product [Candidula unifasciata]|uniref:Voltage-gated hydrogen channel 1 n=1 Tax=Candidula unifasciata TaxID=100452 RepID=A0A8S3Z5F3_9EUPU|nr:unnamed protein product [Candidula unifasciata]